MKNLIVLFLLLAPFYAAVSVSMSPSYTRMSTNSTQSFTIQMEGDGKIYELNVYGPYLDWQTQKVWVGPHGKTLYVTFSPKTEGEYTITADFAGTRSESSVLVYEVKTSDIYEKIQALRSKTSDSKVLEKLDEAERLYNESKFELAELKLKELGDITTIRATAPNELPKLVIAGVIALLALAAFKFLL